jgi:Mn2+/Fe2+ NRAMP family transporter
MNIDATLYGEIVIGFIIVVSILSFYLGKRKTTTPKLASLIGALLSFIPPLALIYLVVLVLKRDINQNNLASAVE